MQIILGGDLNCPSTPLDKAGGTSTERKRSVIREITNVCSNHELQDVWRSQHPNQSQFTWRNNSLKIQYRLDYCLVSKDLSSSLLSTTITSPTFSDHSAVSFVLQSKEYAKRGPGFWKINNSLQGPVHTNAFSFENAYIFIRLRLPSTLIRSKTEVYVCENGGFRKRSLEWRFLKTEVQRLCVDGRKRRFSKTEVQRLCVDGRKRRFSKTITSLACPS